jgi:hypothetical protein
MKSILIIIIALISINANSQVIELCNYESDPDESPIGTYFKDVNNTFTPFLGTWQYTNGNEVITFKIEKVTHYYVTKNQTYEDFIIGNYNFSQDGGLTNIVNKISPSLLDESPDASVMYAPCANDSPNKVTMTFYDVILEKDFGLITFEFLPGSTTQMQATLTNEQGAYGYFADQPEPNFNFSIPTSFVVTKL